MTQKKNIVILKADDSLQNEIAEGITSEFARRYPEYELVVVSEEEYRGLPAFVKKRLRRFFQRVLPAVGAAFKKLRIRRYERRLEKNRLVYAHFQDANKTAEGTRSGFRIIRNIMYRFRPKCVAVLDPVVMSRVVGAKRRYDFNTKLVSVLYDSYFDIRNLFYGVNRYAVLSEDVSAKICGYGLAEGCVDTVRMFHFDMLAGMKSERRGELGLENTATFLVVPSYETRKRFKRMIADIAAADPDFNILVYCGESRRMTRYFERVKLELNLFCMKISEDFDRHIEAADYVLTTPNVRAINRSFFAGALPIVYNNRRLAECRNADFYVEKNLAAAVADEKDFPAALNRLMTSIALESEMKQNAQDYLIGLPARSVADVVYDAARRLDAEQQI